MSELAISQETEPISAETIATWFQTYVAELRGVAPERISRTVPLHKYGLDSASAVTLTGDLMEWLCLEVDPAVLYEHPTIERASAYLASRLSAKS